MKTARGAIVEIVFSGHYGVGSGGNPDADQMVEYVKTIVKIDPPAAVLFNLSNLRYEFGDAIGGIAFPLGIKEGSRIPACIVTHGATAQAMQWFFEKDEIFVGLGFGLFSDRAKGIAFLRERIDALDAQSEK